MPSDAFPPPPRRGPRLLRIVRARLRLAISILVRIVMAFALIGISAPAERLPVARDVGVTLYLIAAYQFIAAGSERTIGRWAAIENKGCFGVLALTVGAALVSLGAIMVLLAAPQAAHAAHMAMRTPQELALATVTILLSWAFILTIFGLHYAHEYYGERGGEVGGPNFPGDDKPDYWDFVYFSFVIGMTSQVSDVSISSRSIPRTVAAHSIVALLFNAALLALTVNIAASAILSPA